MAERIDFISSLSQNRLRVEHDTYNQSIYLEMKSSERLQGGFQRIEVTLDKSDMYDLIEFLQAYYEKLK
jgi:hypothetical protein